MKDINKDFKQLLTDIAADLEGGKKLVSDTYLSDFQSEAEKVCRDLDSLMETSRTLRIGVVGEVKAGKSSFLNALLFNGDSVLPKAPTPMTAALTKISYSKTPVTRVYFYSKRDWEAICNKADRLNQQIEQGYQAYVADFKAKQARSQANSARPSFSYKKPSAPVRQPVMKSFEQFKRENKGNLSAELIACAELVEMAKELDVYSLVSDEPVEISAADFGSDYMKQLEEYVGSKGKYTPIVKYTDIQLDNELLTDIEVVDTPGLNDPVLSRSRVTKNFLMQCDVVFMLSYCGQFFGNDDVQFLTQVLPHEGISRAILIGSKFDSGILDLRNKRISFEQARRQSSDTYIGQARENLAAVKRNTDITALANLDERDLQCVSGLMYSAAKHMENNEPLTHEEEYAIHQLETAFPDFKPTVKTLYEFANIDYVRDNIFISVKADKERILMERQAGLISSQVGKFLSILEDITIQAESNYNELQNSDVDALQSKLDQMTSCLSSLRLKVKAIFESATGSVLSGKNGILIEIMKDATNHTDINVESSVERIAHTHSSGFWFWKKYWTTYENVRHRSANISDLQQNITEYIVHSMEIINKRFESVIRIDEIKREVKSTVIEAFDTSDRDFDETTILLPLESTLRKLIIPALTFDTKKYYDLIDSRLSSISDDGQVTDGNVSIMLKVQNEILESIKADMEAVVKNQCDKACAQLQRESGVFIDDVSSQIQKNVETLMELLKNKQESLDALKGFIEQIAEAKQQLRKVD